MAGKRCGRGGHRKHTPIVSRAQRGLFGAELRRRRKGLAPSMSGITTEELAKHLKESRGKRLAKRSRRKR